MIFAGHTLWPMYSPILYCGSGRPGGGCGISPSMGTTPPAPVNTGGELSSGTVSVLGGWNIIINKLFQCYYDISILLRTLTFV